MSSLRIEQRGAECKGAVPSLRDSFLVSTLPGTTVPGFHIPPLRGWSILALFRVFGGTWAARAYAAFFHRGLAGENSRFLHCACFAALQSE
jgi:hypothetical protein